MGTICHRDHCRAHKQRGRWCGCGGLHDRFHFNSWFINHIHYTAAFVSRLLVPDRQRTVRRILPASTVSSASTADDEEVRTLTEDASYSSRQQTSEESEWSGVDEFQNEVRDFIQNLHVPSTTSTASVSTVFIYLSLVICVLV